ncbi:hypothetical protein BGX27_001028 [Mortierella sp. AM989]|nr:hypothetical protein BGX27_001028 [Mortierella sp. AM989]
MIIPSVESARATVQAALLAYLNKDIEDFVSRASSPLKHHIHTLTRSDGFNLKDSFQFLNQAQAYSATIQTQIEQSMHEHWTFGQSSLLPPSMMGCTSWENAPVFLQQNQRELESEASLVLVPIGQLNSQDIWGAVLLAELVSENEDEQMKGASTCEAVWKYDRLIVISEKELSPSGNWNLLDSCHNQGFIDQLSPHQQKPLCFDVPTEFISIRQQQQQRYCHAEDDEDSDDDYWGQYGGWDDSPIEETTSSGIPAHTRGFSLVSGRNEAETEEDEDDDYWRKYSECHQEEQSEPERKGGQDSPSMSSSCYSSPEETNFVNPNVESYETHKDGSEARRILASLDGISTAPPVPVPNLGEVDSAMLTLLLEKLITHGDFDEEGYPYRFRYQDCDDSCSEYDEMEKYCCQDDVSQQVDQGSSALGSDHGNLISKALSPALTSDGQNWDSCAGSLSQSPLLSDSISSTSAVFSSTTAIDIAATVIKPGMVSQENNHFSSSPSSSLSTSTISKSASISRSVSTSTSYRSLSSGSPFSTASCSDSAFHECDYLGSPGKEFTKISNECVHPMFQSAVGIASTSGKSKTDLFGILDNSSSIQL